MAESVTAAARNVRVGNWWPSGLLLVAAVVVGAAIVADGPTARTLNGIGALMWLVATVGVIRSLWPDPRRWAVGSVVLPVVVALAILVRPRDLAAAIVGFLIGGAIVAVAARQQRRQWALLVPALWLPTHLLLGVGKALMTDGGRIRTEPPPTAAVVPLAMVIAAIAGGVIVTWWQRRSLGPLHDLPDVAAPRA